MAEESAGPIRIKMVTQTAPRKRREYVATDGQGFRSLQAAELHQRALDWQVTEIDLQPMSLRDLAARVQELLAHFGPDAVLGYDAGYNNVGFSVAVPQRRGAKPEDIRW